MAKLTKSQCTRWVRSEFQNKNHSFEVTTFCSKQLPVSQKLVISLTVHQIYFSQKKDSLPTPHKNCLRSCGFLYTHHPLFQDLLGYPVVQIMLCVAFRFKTERKLSVLVFRSRKVKSFFKMCNCNFFSCPSNYSSYFLCSGKHLS